VTITTAKFSVGQLVHHQRFDYHGVVYDIDPEFMASEQWYEQVAKSRPPKDEPWYHVLVHGAEHTTYVAERTLEPAAAFFTLEHPLAGEYFEGHDGERYLRRDAQ